MIRKIIHIDEEKCNGCGACVTACHEGAIGLVNGKAKLMRDDYCDGFGDCLPGCPTGAITFTEREAAAYDEQAVLENKQKKAAAAQQQAQPAAPAFHGCPGSMMKQFHREQTAPAAAAVPMQSQLAQWPCQIKLVPVNAPYFDGAKLLIAADCTAYAYANIHEEFMRGHVTIIGCPKLDAVDYSEKLTEIIRSNDIKSVTVLRMEVPCCGGLEHAAITALKNSGKFIPWIRAFSFPMAVLCILGFVNVGNINYGLRLAYMFVTYVLYEALYTCVNVPFGTLSSVMTDDVSQRTALSRYRSLGGTIFMTVMVMIGPLFLYVDNKPVAGRFLMLACICAMLGLLCLQITCVWCKERVEVPERPQGEKLNYLHVLKEISHNKALLGVMFFSLTGMIGASVVNGLNTYLYKDFFGNVKIQAVSGMLSVLYAVLSFAITQPLANKFGKKEWCCMGAGFAAIVFGILFFFPVHNPVAFIVINGICYLGASGMQVLIWAMVNDAIDYHELQTGERNEGIVYSTYSFFRKLASAISGSLSSFVLGAIGYNVTAGAVQTAGVVNAIWKSYTGVYFLGYGIAVAILFFVYPLTKQKTAEMLTELKARRAAKESK